MGKRDVYTGRLSAHAFFGAAKVALSALTQQSVRTAQNRTVLGVLLCAPSIGLNHVNL